MTNQNTETDLIGQLVKHNKRALIEAMKAAGLASIQADYFGGGDSGNGYELTPTPDNAAAMDQMVTIQVIQSTYDEQAKAWNRAVVEKAMKLDAAVESFCDDVISECGHSGWENGEGGYGDVTLDAESGVCVLDHNDYVIDTDHSHHEL